MLCRRLGLVGALALAGCVEERASVATSAVVYGTDDRVEVYEHPSAALRGIATSAIAMQMSASWLDETNPSAIVMGYRRTLAEARTLCDGQRFADQIEPGTCSGTLIDDRHIVTAGHCVMDETACNGSRVWVFDFRYTSAGVFEPLTSDDVYRCQRVLVSQDDRSGDYAVVELDRPVVGHAAAPITMARSAVGDSVALIGHPNGIPMKIASGGTIVDNDAQRFHATVDAFSGNSGSGVFDDQGRMVGILNSGADDYVANGACNIVNVIGSPTPREGEWHTHVHVAIDAFCALPGVSSPACACDGGCVPTLPGDRCDDAVMVASSSTTDTTTSGYGRDEVASCGGNGVDRFFSFTLTARSHVVAEVTGIDSVLSIRATCDGAEIACNDDASAEALGSRLELDLAPGGYIVVVDSFDDFTGPIRLELRSTPDDAGAPPPDAAVSSRDAAAALPDAQLVRDAAVTDSAATSSDAHVVSAIDGGAGASSSGCSVTSRRPTGAPARSAAVVVFSMLLLARRRARRAALRLSKDLDV